MSEANKIAVVAFYKLSLVEGDVEDAFSFVPAPSTANTIR